STDTKGMATFSFTPSRPGYYSANWSSTDADPGSTPQARDIVTAAATVWVTEHATQYLGYHAGGLDLILDRDTFHAGETASLLILTPASGRWVMLSTATDHLETQVLHLDGTAKLVQIPIGAQHLPDFTVTASSVFDLKLSTEAARISVPRMEKFVK